MRNMTIVEEVTLVSETCCSCGVLFALTEEHRKELLKSKESFYCPNGHSQSYTGTSVKQLERRLANAREDARILAIARDEAEARAAAAETKARKLERRTTNGVCPCCGRTFVQLARHMKAKHPEAIT